MLVVNTVVCSSFLLLFFLGFLRLGLHDDRGDLALDDQSYTGEVGMVEDASAQANVLS